jgi:ubiquinone biosynthesis protein Coq4
MLFAKARAKVVAWTIINSVPVLNLVRRPARWPTLDELDGYPEGTLGHTVADFLRARGLPFKVRYENHDAIHAILDYDTSDQGEMEVQAFLWGNDASSFAGHILFVWGGLMQPEQWSAMRRALRRGRAARPIEEARLPARLHEPIADIRRELEPAAVH